ncbi:cardiac ankyrin repeat protein [Tritrichomonas foetus]|uniref:Cardiac ankyrin repeat protein n=1 Tax=Tritrichomonas foetus TaxID=1144522 RepID=A0A1J4J7C4_9EUKA|nr:cardiac ankyrin repeat protein [Tritrichomonas foetus]|eukprot:OHS93555.1 cardiac ankyrin repeat protein [Tritrichomonas foetus]
MLQTAVFYEYTEFVDFLLQYPEININNQDINGDTALHYAVKCKNIEIIKKLLQHFNIDTSIENNLFTY